MSKNKRGGKKYKEKGVVCLKRIGYLTLISIILFGIFIGCQRDLPKPKTEAKILPNKYFHFIHDRNASAAEQEQSEKPKFFVQYETKGNNLFVECFVTGITFRESNESKQKVGKLHVWVDGKKKQDITAAAFVMKNLPIGNHRLRLEVVNLHNEPFGLSKEFIVKIPEK